jgi:NhaP-type Na+/H+ or K+/H+ antiporter
MGIELAVVALVVVVIGLLSGVLQRVAVTIPMLALAAGVLLGPGLGILPTDVESAGVLFLAELALAVLLFVDASRIDLGLARRNGQVPARMLAIGLPLTIALGALLGSLVLGLSAGAALVLGCLLAPTDAALAQPLLTDERVPLRVRQAINVESGLNDGLVVPALTVALVVAGVEETRGAAATLLAAARLVGLGVAVGVVTGGAVGWALRTIGWRSLAPAARQVGTAAVPVLAYGTALAIDANGFVAAFVAGAVLGPLVPDQHELLQFGEDVGELLAVLTLLVFGAVFVEPSLAVLDWRTALFALLSLAVVRVVAVGVSLLGAGLRPGTVGLLGWFGPRGVATVVFGLEVLELGRSGALPVGEELFGVAALVVVGSVLAHGITARPLARRCAADLDDAAARPLAEMEEVADLPVRRGSFM